MECIKMKFGNEEAFVSRKREFGSGKTILGRKRELKKTEDVGISWERAQLRGVFLAYKSDSGGSGNINRQILNSFNTSSLRPPRRPDDDDKSDPVEFIKARQKPDAFINTLNGYMNQKGFKPSKVYGGAELSRQDYSRIISSSGKHVRKIHVWRLAIGLRLTLSEADNLLASAGYRMGDSVVDLAFSYAITHNIYNVVIINGWINEIDDSSFFKKN